MAIGAALAGIGGSIYAGTRQAGAIADASEEATSSQERIAARQLEAVQPFLDRGVQAQDALAQILGLPPVPTNNANGTLIEADAPDFESYARNNQDLYDTYNQHGSIYSLTGPQWDRDNDGTISLEEWGRWHYDSFGQSEGRDLPRFTQEQIDAVQGEPENQEYDPQTAFENSLFFTAADKAFERDQDRLDHLGATSGSFFSGRNLLAQNETRERNYGNALGQYNNALASLYGGGQVAAGQQQSALGQLGAAQQQAAYQTGQANSGFWGQVGGLNRGLSGFALEQL